MSLFDLLFFFDLYDNYLARLERFDVIRMSRLSDNVMANDLALSGLKEILQVLPNFLASVAFNRYLYHRRFR